MYNRPYKRYQAFKDPVSAKDLNYLLEKIEKIGKIDAIPPISVVNNAGNIQIGLAHLIPGVVRFELQENLDYYGFASAKTIYYNKDTELYEVSAQANINQIRVRDVHGIFTGTGPLENRSGDKGYALSLGVGKGYEVIAIQNVARFIHFEVNTAAFTTASATTLGTIIQYYGGRHIANDTESSSSFGTNQVLVYNPPSANGGYIFSGLLHQRGQAIWDEIDRKYWIWQMEC